MTRVWLFILLFFILVPLASAQRPLKQRGKDVQGPEVLKERAVLPDVRGKTQQEAGSILEAAGVKVAGIIIQQTLDTAANGKVVGFSPAVQPGKAFESSQGITLIIGRLKRVIVPNVVGQPHQEAKQLMEAAGLKVQAQWRNTENATEDKKILKISPPAGAGIDAGSRVYVEVGRFKRVFTFEGSFDTRMFLTGPDFTHPHEFAQALSLSVPKGYAKEINVRLKVAWNIRQGKFKTLALSRDGGWTFEDLASKGDQGTYQVNVYPPAGDNGFLFALKGYDIDQDGKIVGDIKTIKDTVPGKFMVSVLED